MREWTRSRADQLYNWSESSGQGDGAVVLIKKREHLATTYSADLEHQKPFSQQRMKRVSYGRPSQMVLGMECSLLGVSPRWRTSWCSMRLGKSSRQYTRRTFCRAVTAIGQDAARTRRCAN